MGIKMEIQKQFYQVYKGYIGIFEFEERLYKTQEIETVYGNDFYFNLLNLDYRNRMITEMTQGKIEFGDIMDGIHKDSLLSFLNISDNDLLEDYPIQIVSTGHSKVMIGIKSIECLNTLQPNYNGLANLSRIIGCNGYYVFTVDSPVSEPLVHGRMFAPAIGINEDPVTGNANGPLGAYLVHHQLVNHHHSLFKFKAKQGEAIKRPGTIGVEVKIENNEPEEVKVSGHTVIAFKSELVLN